MSNNSKLNIFLRLATLNHLMENVENIDVKFLTTREKVNNIKDNEFIDELLIKLPKNKKKQINTFKLATLFDEWNEYKKNIRREVGKEVEFELDDMNNFILMKYNNVLLDKNKLKEFEEEFYEFTKKGQN